MSQREPEVGKFIPTDTGLPKEFTPTVVPMTAQQREVWLSSSLSENASRAYNIAFSLYLSGPLDFKLLSQALRILVDRYEPLRARFEPKKWLMHLEDNFSTDISFVDLSGKSEKEQKKILEDYRLEEANKTFDLLKGPLFYCSLLHMSEEYNALVWSSHHIVSDGWSLELLIVELAEVYSAMIEGRSPNLKPIFPFSQYSQQQQELRESEKYQATKNYWLEKFKEPLPLLELPACHARPLSRAYHSKHKTLSLDSERTEFITSAGATLKSTFFELTYSAYVAFIQRMTQQNDFVVGVPSAGQFSARKIRLFGHCVNLLPLRHKFSEDLTFKDLVNLVREQMSHTRLYSQITFSELLEHVNIDRDAGRIPIVETTFNVEQENRLLTYGKASAYYLRDPKAYETFDLTFALERTLKGIVVHCNYNEALFNESTIERWLKEYVCLLEGAIEQPDSLISALPLLTKEDKNQLISWNDTKQSYPEEKCLHQLITQQAKQHPKKTAVIFNDKSYTYYELDSRANCLANSLISKGVGSGILVGLCVERSLEMLVGLLGILKAGGGYLPIDPAYPRDRIGYILEDAQAPVLITEQSLVNIMPQFAGKIISLDTDWAEISRCSDDLPAVKVSASDIAYVIYTSGSTGNPKGVQVTHRNMVNFLCSMQKQPGLSVDDRILSVTTLSFDIAVLELYLPLITGASVDIASRQMTLDASMLASRIQESGITVLQATPATWRLLFQSGWKGHANLKALVGGEALPRDIVPNLLEAASEVWNMYGPTETSVWSTCYQIKDTDSPILIGKPIANTQLYVLDPAGQQAPIGVQGELYIGGDGVTQGYLNRPDLNEKSFVQNKFSPNAADKLYRTGDQVKLLASGNLQYLARLDNQVKVRGFRIELGEIESTLSTSPLVDQAIVVTREDQPGDVRIVAYYIAKDEKPSIQALRDCLQQTLPAYMVPHHFICLDAMPQTPNGKVDRKQLPWSTEMRDQKIEEQGSLVEARDDFELSILSVWRRLLDNKNIGITDNFFEHGGHSLLAITAIKEMELATGVEFDAGALFKYSTVKTLIESLGENAENQSSNVVLLQDAEIELEKNKPPLFLLCGVDIYQNLADEIKDRKVYGVYVYSELAIAKDALEGKESEVSFELLCEQYFEAILRVQPTGPFQLGGISFGGFIAVEVAKKIRHSNHEVDQVFLFDTISPSAYKKWLLPVFLKTVLFSPKSVVKRLLQKIWYSLPKRKSQELSDDHELEQIRAIELREKAFISIMEESEDKRTKYNGTAILFKAEDNEIPSWIALDEDFGWRNFISDTLTIVSVPGDHLSILSKENVNNISRVITK